MAEGEPVGSALLLSLNCQLKTKLHGRTTHDWAKRTLVAQAADGAVVVKVYPQGKHSRTDVITDLTFSVSSVTTIAEVPRYHPKLVFSIDVSDGRTFLVQPANGRTDMREWQALTARESPAAAPMLKGRASEKDMSTLSARAAAPPRPSVGEVEAALRTATVDEKSRTLSSSRSATDELPIPPASRTLTHGPTRTSSVPVGSPSAPRNPVLPGQSATVGRAQSVPQQRPSLDSANLRHGDGEGKGPWHPSLYPDLSPLSTVPAVANAAANVSRTLPPSAFAPYPNPTPEGAHRSGHTRTMSHGSALAHDPVHALGAARSASVGHDAHDRRSRQPSVHVVEEEYAHAIDPHSTPIEAYRWFHGRIRREEAEARLGSLLPGSYLVRESERKAGQYVLSVRWPDGCFAHFLIVNPSPGAYSVGTLSFASIPEMLEYYLGYPLAYAQSVLEQKLLMPVLRPGASQSAPASSTVSRTPSNESTSSRRGPEPSAPPMPAAAWSGANSNGSTATAGVPTTGAHANATAPPVKMPRPFPPAATTAGTYENQFTPGNYENVPD